MGDLSQTSHAGRHLAPGCTGGAPARCWARRSSRGAGGPAGRALRGSRRYAPEGAKSAVECLSALT